MEFNMSAIRTSCWICLFVILIMKEKAAAVDQLFQKSGLSEEISHYGMEFILGMTDYERSLHIASEQKGTYNISVPDSNIAETGSLAVGSTTVYVDTDIHPGIRKGNGLHIVTSVPVSVCVSDKGYGNKYGVFLALPVPFTGNLYMVPAYKRRFFGVVVAAAYKNTSVDLAYFLNKTETIHLPRILDTYTTIGYEEDRSSTVILANKPVSVIVGTSRNEDDSHSSILVQQALPYDALTNEYIVPPLPPNKKYMIRVMSVENQTVCFKTEHNNTCYEINSVSNMNYVLSTEAMVVSSSSPISVIEHGANICNRTEYGPETFPYMILIPGIKNFLNKYSFVIPDIDSNSEHFLVVIVPSSKASELLIDGYLATFSNSYSITTYQGGYHVMIKSISIGYHIMFHPDPSVRFGAIAYGTDGSQCTSTTSRSYGFALGYTYNKTKYHSGLNNWTRWSKCSASCNVGTQFRERSCNIKNTNEEQGCSGHKGETRQCLLQICEDTSVYDTWSSWSICSMSCGGGVQSREGVCSKAVNVTKACNILGTFTETRHCNSNPCPIDGGFGAWSTWSDCSVTCDIGLQDRTRPCDNPVPLHGGKNCIGAREEAKNCFRRTCKGNSFGYTCGAEGDKCGGENTVCLNNKCGCVVGHQFDGMKCISNDGPSSDNSENILIIMLSVGFGVVIVSVLVFVAYRKRNNCRYRNNCDGIYRGFDTDLIEGGGVTNSIESFASVRGDSSEA